MQGGRCRVFVGCREGCRLKGMWGCRIWGCRGGAGWMGCSRGMLGYKEGCRLDGGVGRDAGGVQAKEGVQKEIWGYMGDEG